MTVASLLVNIVMVVLLAATIAYCWVLNRRIQVLQDSKSELAQLLKHFDESTTRASESIIALQGASKKIGENIQMRVDKANYLIDDLGRMLEKGSKLADQLEADIAVNRARNRVDSGQEFVEEKRSAPSQQPAAPQAAQKEKTRASLEAMLERVVARSKPVWPSVEKESAAPSSARSRSEQELMDMLKTGLKG